VRADENELSLVGEVSSVSRASASGPPDQALFSSTKHSLSSPSTPLTGSSSSLFSYYNTIRSDDFTSRQPLLTRQRSSCSSSLALYLSADLFHVHFSLFYPPSFPSLSGSYSSILLSERRIVFERARGTRQPRANGRSLSLDGAVAGGAGKEHESGGGDGASRGVGCARGERDEVDLAEGQCACEGERTGTCCFDLS
jgi:hypothetical protein